MIPSVELWRAFMAHTVTVYPFTGSDAYGEATYGAGTTYPAHIESQVEQVAIGNGQIVSSRLNVIIGAAVVMDTRDRLVVPGLFGHRNSAGVFPATEDAEIIAVDHVVSDGSHHHTEVRTK